MATAEEHDAFLEKLEPSLVTAWRSAVGTYHDAPDSCFVHLRSLAQCYINLLEAPSSTAHSLHDAIEAAFKAAVVTGEVREDLHALRLEGNRGAHPEKGWIEMTSLPDAMKKGWNLLAHTFVRDGGAPADVPTFITPSLADSSRIFREAILGGPGGVGIAQAKYAVAQAIIARERRAAEPVPVNSLVRRRGTPRLVGERAIDYLREATEVPGAAALLASLLVARYELKRGTLKPTERSSDEVEQDIWEAESLLRQWSDWGDAACQFSLGAWYHDGKFGCEQDYVKALELFEKAAEKEEPRALNALATYYQNGLATTTDLAKARQWALRSAELGDVLGMVRAGKMLIEGDGGEVDLDGGARLLRRAMTNKFGYAFFVLVGYVESGRISALPAERDASALLDAACKHGSAEAMLERAKRGRITAASAKPEQAAAIIPRVLTDLFGAQAEAERVGADVVQGEALLLREMVLKVARSLTAPGHRRIFTAFFAQLGPNGVVRSVDEMGRAVAKVPLDKLPTDEEMVLWGQWMYGEIGMSDRLKRSFLRHVENEKVREANLREAAKRAGRNTLCPCGSGLKAKKCHLQQK